MIVISTTTVIVVLNCLNNFTQDSQELLPKDQYSKFRQSFNYVFGTLLNQGTFRFSCKNVNVYVQIHTARLLHLGGYCRVKKIRFRLVVGSWCLATFLFINIYSCTLISHLFAPKYTPIIKSVHDLINNTNVHLLVRNGYGIDSLISVKNDLYAVY